MGNCCSRYHSNAKDSIPEHPLKVGERERTLDVHPRSSEEDGKESVQSVRKGVEEPRIQHARSLGASEQIEKNGFKVKTSCTAEKGIAGDLARNQNTVKNDKPDTGTGEHHKNVWSKGKSFDHSGPAKGPAEGIKRRRGGFRVKSFDPHRPAKDLENERFKWKSFDKEQPTGRDTKDLENERFKGTSFDKERPTGGSGKGSTHGGAEQN